MFCKKKELAVNYEDSARIYFIEAKAVELVRSGRATEEGGIKNEG
jgi:hypothetical protein